MLFYRLKKPYKICLTYLLKLGILNGSNDGELPKWLRGHPAKVLDRETGARVQIPHSPPVETVRVLV